MYFSKGVTIINIVFISSACSKKTYSEIFLMRNRRILDPSQKFLEQLMSGTSKNEGTNVISISARPVSASSTSKKYFAHFEETENQIKYVYPSFVNGKILRYATCFFSTLRETAKVLKKIEKKETVLICDPLTVEVSLAARIAGCLFGVKSLAIITDIPFWATEMKQHKYGTVRKKFQQMYEKISFKEIGKYDGYILLTDSMNEIVNKKKRKYMVLEGSIDYRLKEKNDTNEEPSRVVLYAGGIYEKYGVKNLVEAFIKSDIDGYELHLYGEGSYVDELKQMCKENKKVKYKGCALNTDLVEIEKKAMLLVNPRFSDEEYTKYSFPSKTLEYMSSGTAVLSTRLKGIPREYDSYLYYFDGETVPQMCNTLRKILSLSTEELIMKGKSSQKFVFENKSSNVQGKKIIQLAEKIIK